MCFVLSEGLEGCKARPKVEDWLWMRKGSQTEVGIFFELLLVCFRLIVCFVLACCVGRLGLG